MIDSPQPTRIQQSAFLYLNKRKLTLPLDVEKYKAANMSMYKRIAFNVGYTLLLCKMHSMTTMPSLGPRSFFYSAVFISVLGYSMYE